jgi:predicted metal-dependent peptidase
MRKYPFYGVLLKNIKVYYDPETTVTPAYIHKLDLYLTKDFLIYTKSEKLFIIIHELNHLLLKHSIRVKEYIEKYEGIVGEHVHPHIKRLINITLDAKANQYNEMKISGYSNLVPVYPHHISRLLNYKVLTKQIEEMSSEEIIDLLMNKENVNQVIALILVTEPFKYATNDIILERQIDKVVEIQKSGDEEGKLENIGESEQELEKELLRKIMTAYNIAKTIGNIPGEIERIIQEILKPQVNWKVILKNAIMKGLGKNVKRIWTRPSRKYPLFPGKELLKINKVIVMIDTSGSISDKELQQFVSEVYSIVGEISDVTVILWDADVQGEFKLKRHSDVNKIKIIGGGGTYIYPVLKYAIKKCPNGLYVILSDWNIGDANNNAVKQLLLKMKPICITTDCILKVEGLDKNFIKIKI